MEQHEIEKRNCSCVHGLCTSTAGGGNYIRPGANCGEKLGQAQSRADEIIRDRKEKAEQEAQALSEKTLKQKQNVINKLIQETLS